MSILKNEKTVSEIYVGAPPAYGTKVKLSPTDDTTVTAAINELKNNPGNVPDNVVLVGDTDIGNSEPLPNNADLLGGHPVEYFGAADDITEINNGLNEVFDRGYLTSKGIESGSVDTLTSGEYFVNGFNQPKVLNLPNDTDAWWHIKCISHNTYAWQEAIDWSGYKKYQRIKTESSGWQPWKEIATMDRINSLILDHNLNLYVNATTGNDTTGDGTESKPFASINRAVKVVPLITGSWNITINVAEGIYTENIYLFRTGVGNFTIKGSGINSASIMDLMNCSTLRFRIENITINGMLNCSNGYNHIENIAMTSNSEYGVVCDGVTSVQLINVIISNKTECAILSRSGGNISMVNVSGSNNNIVLSASYAGRICEGYGSTITGTTQKSTLFGGEII